LRLHDGVILSAAVFQAERRMGLRLHDGVILSAAVFQAERRISRLAGPTREPNCMATVF